jgi:hypothetical protein
MKGKLKLSAVSFQLSALRGEFPDSLSLELIADS